MATTDQPGSHNTQPGSRNTRPRGRRKTRITAAFVLVAALLLPLSVLFAQFWTFTGEDAEFTANERRGVAYLRPLTRLIGALDEAQADAVRGVPVNDDGVRSAMAAVAEVDKAEGERLRAATRWTDLARRTDAILAGTAGAGQDAYRDYSEVIDLAVGLATKVGDESNLILDPALDSYYLLDTALLQLPQVVVNAGRVADLSVVSPEPARIAIARDRVASAAQAVDNGLAKSLDATRSQTLGPNVLVQLDGFRSSVDALAPAGGLLDRDVARFDAGAATAIRTDVRRAALQLGGVVLAELDDLLRARQERQAQYRAVALAAIVTGAVLAAAMLWVRAPAAEPAPPGDVGTERPAGGEGLADELAVREVDLVDARQLLIDELVHVGRGVRTRPRSEDDDPR